MFRDIWKNKHTLMSLQGKNSRAFTDIQVIACCFHALEWLYFIAILLHISHIIIIMCLISDT